MPPHHQRPPWPSHCKAKHLLLRDIRPTPNSQSQSLLRKSDLCPTKCIYCDIWKLALLVSSRPNTSTNSPTSPSSSPQQQQRSQQYSRSPSSPRYSPSFSSSASSSPTTFTHQQALKTIESAHTLQRARLSSIISICTVEGAEESEGLRIAHDRCLSAVLELVRKERALLRQSQKQEQEQQMMTTARREREKEGKAIREWREREYEYYSDRTARYGYEENYYGTRGSGNAVSCAM